jgi:deoxyribose-phosphate aldolase
VTRSWTRFELAARVDHTLLDPAATHHDVLMACEIARRNRCASVCLNSNRVAQANEVLRGTGVGIAAVVGFPFGASHMGAKAKEAALAVADGATEIDMVLDIGRLTDDEKRSGCGLAVEAGAALVKTSTGYLGHGATLHDVALIRAAVGPDLGVKASGGILYYEDAVAMLEAGATRLGMSHTQQVLDSIPM